METIVIKVPSGTKARLKSLGDVSKVLRNQIAMLFENGTGQTQVSAFDKCSHLAGSIKGGRRGAKGNDYLGQYAKKNAR
jgi:hypothetical protein